MRWVGLSAAVPRRSVEATAAYDRFPKADVDRILGNIGVLRHREARPGTTAADLCKAAAEPLLEKLGWARDSVDALFFMTQTPDHYFPGTGYRLQHELGLPSRCFTLDVNQACAGFTHGIILLRSMMATGLIKRALLLSGEVTTGTVRPGICEATRDADLGTALLFGDAGAAAAFEASDVDEVKAASWGSDGKGFKLISVPGGGFKEFVSPKSFELTKDEDGIERRRIDVRVNAAAIFVSDIRRVPPLVEELLSNAGWTRPDVDRFVFSQSSKFILEFLRNRMSIPPEKMPLTLEEFGNTSSASVPLTALTRISQLEQGPTKLILAGFGAGLSWSGVAIESRSVATLPLIDFDG